MGIEVVEAEAEDGQVGGEFGIGAVEENVFLEVGFGVERREKAGELLVRERVRQPELHLYFHIFYVVVMGGDFEGLLFEWWWCKYLRFGLFYVDWKTW